jgi:hypothetical protein
LFLYCHGLRGLGDEVTKTCIGSKWCVKSVGDKLVGFIVAWSAMGVDKMSVDGGFEGRAETSMMGG